ncbi:MAG: hypothetical protein ACYSUB_01860 [Planctomycetota bacterium]
MPKISKITITANTPTPKIKKYTLALKFPLHSEEELDTAELAKMLQYVMREWNDGRHPFEAEMVESGLSRCLKQAVYEAISKEAQDEFGHETVTSHSGRGHTSKWYIEAQKRYDEKRKPWVMSEPEVEIT